MNLPKSQRCRLARRLGSASPKIAVATRASRRYPAARERPEIKADAGGLALAAGRFTLGRAEASGVGRPIHNVSMMSMMSMLRIGKSLSSHSTHGEGWRS